MDVPERIWAKVHGAGTSISAAGSLRYLVGGFRDRPEDGHSEYILATVSAARVAAARAEGFTAGCERMRETVASDLEEFAETMRYRNPNPEPMKRAT